MEPTLTITVDPVDERRCTFTVSRPVAPTEERRFSSSEEARGTPVAEAVLAVPGIDEVVVSGRTLTVVRGGDAGWQELEEPVRYAIASALEGIESQPRAPTVAVQDLDDDEMFALVEEVFERDVNPAVARHGGRVELIDVQDHRVILRMMGGCQGCGMANVTLRQGIEASLRRMIPALRGIEDITDHASGTTPYFAKQ
jgi:Fe-S cluster biogenesis protein NfuA